MPDGRERMRIRISVVGCYMLPLSFAQQLHEAVAQPLLFGFGQGVKFLAQYLCEGLFCPHTHLGFACAQAAAQLCLRQQLPVEISVTHH